MRFKRIYLAGSVLPCDYPWAERFYYQQLEDLRNDRSSLDWPVGILCSGLRGVGMHDIGTGGFDGFRFDDGRTQEVFYYNGGHGKPLEESNLDNIIDYILTGKVVLKPEVLISAKKVSSLFRWCSRIAPYVAPVLLALLLLIFCVVIQGIASDFLWVKLVLPLVTCLIVWIVLETA